MSLCITSTTDADFNPGISFINHESDVHLLVQNDVPRFRYEVMYEILNQHLLYVAKNNILLIMMHVLCITLGNKMKID